ncbi:MAG: hypothetical protein NTW96_07695 [Planctomycetia bacterium]|nr:hypothetical protein [Planctomycetia bacterium]
MIDVLSRMSPSDLPIVLTVPVILLGGMLTAVIVYAITAFQRHREKDLATTLVLEMLDRGIPPAEIAAILKTMGLDQPPEGRTSRLRLILRSRGRSASEPAAQGAADSISGA